MGVLTIHDVDDALIQKLEARASAEGISTEELLRQVLQKEFGAADPTTIKIIEAFEELGRLGLDLEGVTDWSKDWKPKVPF